MGESDAWYDWKFLQDKVQKSENTKHAKSEKILMAKSENSTLNSNILFSDLAIVAPCILLDQPPRKACDWRNNAIMRFFNSLNTMILQCLCLLVES